jgi:putative ABC transport system permease protein
MNDLRFALRQLRKSPGFTFVAVLTLALCIGANTAIFSVINAVLLRPLPYPDSDQITILSESDANQPDISVSFPDYVDWRKENTVFENIAVTRRESYNLSGLSGREPEQVSGAIVTANFFKVIGLSPQLGRVFTEEEDRVGGPQLAVISDKLWGRLFQRDSAVLGRVVNFGNQPYTIIGVMPPQMFSPRTVDVWFPLMRRTDNQVWQSRDNHPGLFGWARLKEGVSLEKAQAEMSTIAARLAQQYPNSNTRVGVNVKRLLENQVGEYRSSLMLLLGAVAVVLLIGCANLANLLAARGATRSREIAIRVAIGATRWQIIRQLLFESLVLAVLGGLLGLCLAAWGRDLLVALSPQDVKRFQETRIDGVVFAFTGLLAIVTSVLFGLWPAWQMSRADAQTALKAGEHGASDTRAARRSRELLIVAEVALTLLLLSTAALVLRSFSKAMSMQLGFDSHNLLTARIDLPEPAYEDKIRVLNFSNTLLDKVRALPGIEHAALAYCAPLMTGWQTSFRPEGAPEPPNGEYPAAEMAAVMGDYFSALRVPLLRGRTFAPQDTRDTPRVVIIDQLLAERHFPGQDPIGKRLLMYTDPSGRKPITIIGVVPHLKLYGYEETTVLPQAYFAQTQAAENGLVLLLRTSLRPDALEKPLREIVAAIDPNQPVFEVRMMQDLVAETWATPRLMSFLLATFSGLALTLALVGLYGVMSYNGVRRMREIGVRLALGARRRQISAMMLGQGIRLLAMGLVAGFAGALALSRVIRSLLFQVNASDPAIYAAVSVLLVFTAILACWIPARRAARVDPMIILRTE